VVVEQVVMVQIQHLKPLELQELLTQAVVAVVVQMDHPILVMVLAAVQELSLLDTLRKGETKWHTMHR
jgi:hypothetical protein